MKEKEKKKQRERDFKQNIAKNNNTEAEGNLNKHEKLLNSDDQ